MTNYKIHIGDVFYEPSFMYRKVLEWKIEDIFLEAYIGCWKTAIRVSNEDRQDIRTVYASDVLSWFTTKEDAEKALEDKLNACPFWRDIESHGK